jgi:hypothetical protein
MPSFRLARNQTAREDSRPSHQDTKGRLTGRFGRKGRKRHFHHQGAKGTKKMDIRKDKKESAVQVVTCRGLRTGGHRGRPSAYCCPHQPINRFANREIREAREEARL